MCEHQFPDATIQLVADRLLLKIQLGLIENRSRSKIRKQTPYFQ